VKNFAFSSEISIEQRVAELIVKKRMGRDRHTSRAYFSVTQKKRMLCLKCRNVLSIYEQRDGLHICGSCSRENEKLGMRACSVPSTAIMHRKHRREES
jgi:hypothetical protein